ncbi:phospholipid-transporting ATPase ABCA3 [Patella vulgata]|uniref:phospholipid-transporting ATPase ABCA3 n=1 Tax=Patella vulgata TaxID=6465 RepID=UPI0024A87E03|nr:phospholipid-transporting ATPase ABCA3 [Patella vulgata]
MMKFFRQVGILLWKNSLIQRRKICASVVEVLSPLLLVTILVLIRLTVPDNKIYPPKVYEAVDLTIHENWFGGLLFYYAPKTPIVDDIMHNFITTLTNDDVKGSRKYNATGFISEADLLKYATNNSDYLEMAFVFDNITTETKTLPRNVQYALRPKSNNDWNTGSNFPVFGMQDGSYSTNDEYIRERFVHYQRYLDAEIIKYWVPTSNLTDYDYSIQQMPYPAYENDQTISSVQFMFPLILCFSFIVSVFITAKNIIYEKENNLKESMKMMGLTSSANWTAWFLTVFIYLFVAVVFYTMVMLIPIEGKSRVLAHSDMSVIFVFLLCYVTSIISFCFLVSVFFDRANLGASVTGILYFLSFVPFFVIFVKYKSMSRSEKLGASILSNTAMGIGGYIIGFYEQIGEGVQWSNIASPAYFQDNYCMLDAMLMLLGDSAIYLTIMWYIENVHPGKHGVPRPLYFPFTRSYWCGTSPVYYNKNKQTPKDSKFFEKEPTGCQAGIVISDLTKEFKSRGGKKNIAVDNMNLNVYQGQITVLLGHNGAGKTTTMSMLTGFIPPTSGKATVNGHDITTDIDGVRESLGLCPQHNILFDTLTVDEHLEFFLLLKGGNRTMVKQEIQTTIQEIGLEPKRNTRSQNLSGGQKRKLSLGIALIGGSQTVILDEPTSGMDPAARRQTWDILQRNRSSRTILLTTHFMDEADLLGDRIAIMADGRVHCCGGSHFLKQLYGSGYHLIMVKSETCDVSVVTQLVQSHIPSATLESEISAEISYLLPNEASPKFSPLFKDIEIKKDELGINSFGTTATTMEEVFLKVGNEVDDVADNDEDDNARLYRFQNLRYTNNELPETSSSNNIDVEEDILAFNQGLRKVTGIQLELHRFYGMFIKKAIHTWRNKLVTVFQFLIPVLFTILALAVSIDTPNYYTEQGQQPSLTLDLKPFSSSITAYGESASSNVTDELSNKYSGLFSAGEATEHVTHQQAQNFTKYFLDMAKQLKTDVYTSRMVIGADFVSVNTKTTSIRGFYNGKPYHSPGIAVSFMMNALAKVVSSDDTVSITTRNHPLPQPTSNNYDYGSDSVTNGFLIGFCMMFGMCFLASSLSVFLIKERQVGAKHLQKVSGVGPVVYWLANITWDFINYMMPSLLIIIAFASYGNVEFNSGSNLSYVFLVLFMYGLAVIPFIYTLQFMFKTPPGGMAAIIIFSIFSGALSIMTVYILSLRPDQRETAQTLDVLFSMLLPHHNLGLSLLNIVTNYNNLDYCSENPCDKTQMYSSCCPEGCHDFCKKYESNYLSLNRPGIGLYILMMAVQSVLYFSITLCIEGRIPQRIWYYIRPNQQHAESIVNPAYTYYGGQQTDSDVTSEANRVQNMDMDRPTDSFILNDLYKRYGNFVAVDHISVGIPDKECFGLLGQNGAGKTTTFKMLTGDVMVTSGNAYLNSNDIKSSIQKVQENMGYCPQFDALIDQMTGVETLYMYGRLKGIPENQLKGVVYSLIDILMLKKYANKLTQVYSGGNKRKLSTAIALIGDPGFILLDEPSTGVDPKARRQLWNVLSKVRASGKTLILTSHSMEECDALCTRVAIMVNGSFKCLGSPQHLKNKFGQGYTLICRMKTNEDDGVTSPIEPLVQFIKSNFPSAIVFDDHQGYAHFQIPDNNTPLAGVFDVMEESKSEYSVEDYSVHQTTLEQVFLAFAGKQIPPHEDKISICKRICCCC